MTRYIVLLMVLFFGIQEGLAKEQASVQVPDKAGPCVKWGKTRLEKSLAGAGYDVGRGGKARTKA